MANTTLTQTGAQVQSILNKADKLPATVGTNGQVLTSDGTNLSWQTPQGGGTQLYKHTIRLSTSFEGLNTATEQLENLWAKFEIINSRSSAYTGISQIDLGNERLLVGRVGDISDSGIILGEGVCVHNSTFENLFAIYDKYTSSTTHSLTCETGTYTFISDVVTAL